MTAETVLTALASIRAPQTQDEYDLHGLTAEALQNAEIEFRHEAPLAPRCRIDFLCDSVGIEIKRGRPDRIPVEKQLRRYAETGKLSAVILLSEKTLPSLPGFIAGVPIYPVSLFKLWGIATEVGAEETPEALDNSDILENLSEQLPESEKMMIPEQEEASYRSDSSEENLQLSDNGPDEQTPPPPSYILPSTSYSGLEDQILRDLSQEDVPPFLRDGEPAAYYYGTLSYNARRKCWTIKGDPAVTELAKRLFPGGRFAKDSAA